MPKTVSTYRFPVIETLLSSCILEARSLGYEVSMNSMYQMALNFLDDLNIPHKNLKASLGWAKKFIDRQGLSSRRVSTLNQHNPKDITQKVIRFIVYMRGVLERHSGAKLWACDETPVFYDLINKSTYDKKGKKEIKIRTTGADKKMVTVIPVTSSDGDKKPITIIFKGKGKGKEDKNLVNRDDCTVLFSDNGWLQTSTSVDFLHSNFTREDSSEEILVWDSYRCHYITEEIKNALKELNLVNVIIPGGCTRVIQTCDVVWNSPLKAHLRTLWDDWMQNGEKSFTKNGNMSTISKTYLVDNIV